MAATILLGLASRHWPVLGKQPGDVLYATLAYAGLRALAPQASPSYALVGGFALATAVEFAKLWHLPALEAVRATVLGGLVLGHGFLWLDICCYALGVCLGRGLDGWLSRERVRGLPA